MLGGQNEKNSVPRLPKRPWLPGQNSRFRWLFLSRKARREILEASRKDLIPIVLLSLLGLGVAGYLTLYQLGLLSSVWDPLFGSSSSQDVLNSPVLDWLPVPDALLGALLYLGEFSLALALLASGGKGVRTLLQLLVGIGAATGVVLLGLQVFMIHELCFLCLCSAALSIVMLFLPKGELSDEVEGLDL